MSLVYWLQEPGGTLVDITDRCRLYQFDMGEDAKEGSTNVNQLQIDDPLGDLELFGHRILAVEETDAVDSDDRFVFVGFIGNVKTVRGAGDRTGAARTYQCEVSDVNTILTRRVMIGNDNDRPDETDNERIAWILSTHEGSTIDDTRYVTSSDPWDMDANDYLLQQALAVYGDCSQQSGKNFFATYFGDVGVTTNTPWGAFSLWYEHAEADVYTSTATLTNILDDIDPTNGNFYIGLAEDTNLVRDPMMVYSDVMVPFKNSYVYAYNLATRDTFARRDVVMPAPNVSKKTTAQARARRYTRDLATPDDTATIKTTVPRSLVNLIRPGMQVPVKVSHWPGYEDEYLYMRVKSRRVKEISESDDLAAFELTLELSRGLPGPAPGPLYGVLQGSGGPFPQNPGYVNWANPGDTPGPGWELKPTTGLITPHALVAPTKLNRPWDGWEITGTGTVDVHEYITLTGVVGGVVTIHVAIQLNGVDVESEDIVPGWTAGLAGWTGHSDLTATGISVVPGDIIKVSLGWTGPMYFGRTPAGTGQNNERLEITGGSLT